MKDLVLVGGSGSIGTQVLDIIRANPSDYRLLAIGVGRRVDRAIEAAKEFKVQMVGIGNAEDYERVKAALPGVKVVVGDDGLKELASIKCDLFVNALVGFAGLVPTLTAIEHRNNIALANKESLVVGGELVYKKLKEYGVTLYPIDSEHSAIFQCLQGNQHKEIHKLIITASGGSFRDKTREELVGVSKSDALAHPNWSMGQKITIDSATMMNKGFEIMEAHFLFDVPYSQIETVMHRQSIVHSMVEYCDHSVIAQLGVSDMRIPIQYALSYPERLDMKYDNELDLIKIGTLNFEELSHTRYPLLDLAYEVGEAGGVWPAVMNGANEVVVAAFLNEKISFLDIERIVMDTVHNYVNHEYECVDDLIKADKEAREYANAMLERK